MHLPKSTECTTSRMNCNVNYRFGVVRMHQHRFIKCTTLVRDDCGIGYGQGRLETEVYGKSLYFLLDFTVNLKLLKK